MAIVLVIGNDFFLRVSTMSLGQHNALNWIAHTK